MSEQLLNGDVVALLQQMDGERVTERVARGGLRNAGAADGILHSPLEDRFVEVVAATAAE